MSPQDVTAVGSAARIARALRERPRCSASPSERWAPGWRLSSRPRGRRPPASPSRACEEFERLEQIFSRFRRDSELSRLNEAGAIEASGDLRTVVELALAARERTSGRFDPTLHDAIVAAGYDRTFDELDEDAPAHPAPDPRAARNVVVRGHRIELGPGVGLDLGGIVKGYAADRCAGLLAPVGPCLVNAGGDLAVRGPRAEGPWPVAVSVPGSRLTLALAEGGLATSGRDRRRWRQRGEERHHLIDPATCRPAAGGPLTVTVAAPTATEAEVAAKSIFLAGPQAEREAERLGAPTVMVLADGRTRLMGGLA